MGVWFYATASLAAPSWRSDRKFGVNPTQPTINAPPQMMFMIATGVMNAHQLQAAGEPTPPTPPVLVAWQRAQQADAGDKRKRQRCTKEEPSAENGWTTQCGRGRVSADVAATLQKGLRPCNPASMRPWENGGAANSSTAARSVDQDNIPEHVASKSRGAAVSYVDEAQDPKWQHQNLVVLRCDCEARGLTGNTPAVMANHRALATLRWELDGARIWSACPPCVAKALGAKTLLEFVALGAQENRTPEGFTLKNGLQALYLLSPSSTAKGKSGLREVWAKLKALNTATGLAGDPAAQGPPAAPADVDIAMPPAKRARKEKKEKKEKKDKKLKVPEVEDMDI